MGHMRGRTASLTLDRDSSFALPGGTAPLAVATTGFASGSGPVWAAAGAAAAGAGHLPHAASVGRSSFGSSLGSPRALSGVPGKLPASALCLLGPGGAPGAGHAASAPASPSLLLASGGASRAASGGLGAGAFAASGSGGTCSGVTSAGAETGSSGGGTSSGGPLLEDAPQAWAAAAPAAAATEEVRGTTNILPLSLLGLPATVLAAELGPPRQNLLADAQRAGSLDPPQPMTQQEVWAIISGQHVQPGPADAAAAPTGGVATGPVAACAPSDLVKEMAVMRRLDHPNVVRLHEVIFDPSDPRLIIMVRNGLPRAAPGCGPTQP
jgi:hypothetical protein